MVKSKDIYAELLIEYRNDQVDYFRKLDTANREGVFVGVTEEKKPYLMFHVPKDELFQLKTTDCSVFFIRCDNLDNTCYKWKVIAKDKKSFDLFYVVIDDLISLINGANESFPLSVLNRIALWIEFFKKTNNGILEFKKQIGLFGELLFIQDCLQRGISSVINSWVGPFAKTKDFVFDGIAIETKTTIQSDTNRVPISDENQLDPSGFDSLYLNYRQVTVDQLDGQSLPELIDEITHHINSTELLSLFSKALMSAGYFEQLGHLYTDRFIQISSSYYTVMETFPSITPAKLDKGIKYVSYQIELSTMNEFLTVQDCIFNELQRR